jgi:hypothetical protein
MNKRLMNLVVMVALAATICLPGMAQANYVANWVENGLYGTPANYQTWDTAEAFLLSPGTWTGTGLTINSGTGWTATLINPQYALATTTTPYISKTQGNFYFTTSATDLTGPFSFDWVLSNGGTIGNGGNIVGVYNLTWTPSGGWTGNEYTPAAAPPENRAHAPLPPSLLLLGSALVGLGLLRRRKPATA